MKTKEMVITVQQDGIKADTYIPISVQCLSCAHIDEGLMSCKAFLDGIPTKILTGGFDHTEAFAGDNGIRFEALKRQSNV